MAERTRRSSDRSTKAAGWHRRDDDITNLRPHEQRALTLQRDAGNQATTGAISRGDGAIPPAHRQGAAVGVKVAESYKRSLEKEIKKDFGYLSLDSMKIDVDAAFIAGNEYLADKPAGEQLKFGLGGEGNSKVGGGGKLDESMSVNAEWKTKLDKNLPTMFQHLIPNTYKAKLGPSGGEIGGEGYPLQGTFLDGLIDPEVDFADLALKFNVVEWKPDKPPKFMTLSPMVKVKPFQIPLSLFGGQFGEIKVQLTVSVKFTPNWTRIAADGVKLVTTEAGLMGLTMVAIPAVSWAAYWRTVSSGSAIRQLTGQPIEPVREFARAYWATFHGQPAGSSEAARQGAAAAGAAMKDLAPAEIAAAKARDLYGEGWDLAWPRVRGDIESSYFDEYGGRPEAGESAGGGAALLLRVLDSIESHKGR